MTTTTCEHKGCNRKSSHYLTLYTPAVGHPDEMNISGIIGIKLCKDHARQATVADFLTPELMDATRWAVRFVARSMIPPDFDRSWLEVRRFDKAWLDFIATRPAGSMTQ